MFWLHNRQQLVHLLWQKQQRCLVEDRTFTRILTHSAFVFFLTSTDLEVVSNTTNQGFTTKKLLIRFGQLKPC